MVANDLDKAAVVRGTLRTAVLERAVAQAFALKDWIQVVHAGRVTSYEISATGRAATQIASRMRRSGRRKRAEIGDRRRVRGSIWGRRRGR